MNVYQYNTVLKETLQLIIQTDIGKINVLEQAITTIVSGVARLESRIILLSTGAVDSLIKHVSGKKCIREYRLPSRTQS